MDQTFLQPASTEAIQATISGGVSGQVAVGSYILQIGSVHGGVVNINLPEQKPRLKERPAPVYVLPRRFAGLLDRTGEVEAASTSLPASQPVEFHAEGGSGKTSLLRVLARHPLTTSFPDGVIYLSARGQAPADLLQSIFDALFEYDAPYKPSEGEIRYTLQNKKALILLDDVELGREEVEALFDAAPECTFLLASPERKLWGEGLSLALPGLPPEEARRFLERELGRELTELERQDADDLCKALSGHPLSLVQAAALVREHGVPLQRLAALAREENPDRKLAAFALGLLTPHESKAVAAIGSLGGAPLSARHLPAVTGVPGAERVLAGLQKRGLIQDKGSGYTLAGSFSGVVLGAWDLGPWRAGLLDYFRSWAAQQLQDPRQILDEADGILRLIEAAIRTGNPRGALGLVRAVEGALVLSRRWGAWEQALQRGLEAAEASGDLKEKAWALHQLGTRLMSLNEKEAARRYLVRALRLRETIGDQAGAAVTRHNLRLLISPPGGGASRGGGNGRPKGPARPGISLYALPLAALGALFLTGIVTAVVFAFQTSWLPPVVTRTVEPTATEYSAAPATTPSLPDTGGLNSPTPTSSLTVTAPVPTETAAIPTETSTPTPSDTVAPSPTLCTPERSWPVYTVHRGDTLSFIAAATGSTVRELRRANCLTGNFIVAGQLLYVPRLPVPTATPTLTFTPIPTPSLTPTPTDTFTSPPPAPPDLIVPALTVDPASLPKGPAGGLNIPVAVTVSNQGGQAAGPFQVRVYLLGIRPRTHTPQLPDPLVFDVGSLAPGSSITLQRAFSVSGFDYEQYLVRAIADDCGGQAPAGPCQVVESDETNNQSADQPVELPNLPNLAPSAMITSPDRDLSLPISGADDGGWYGELVLRGEGSDSEEGALGGESLTWASDVDGPLGSGGEIKARLHSGRCPGAVHIITLTARDSQGAIGTATRQITLTSKYDCRPTISVEQPQDIPHYVGDNVTDQNGQRAYFLNIDGVANAYDLLGADISDSLVWSVDGKEVGTGGRPAFTLTLLDQSDSCEQATYTLLITATDRVGNQARVKIPVTLEECPGVG